MRLQYNVKKETTNIIELTPEQYSLIRFALDTTSREACGIKNQKAAEEMYNDLTTTLHDEAELI